MPTNIIYVDTGVARKRIEILSHTAKNYIHYQKIPSGIEIRNPPLLTPN